jgi:hypothetical protein
VMRRDMDLIRKLALAIEDSPTGYAPRDLAVDGFTDDQIGYHLFLMLEARLIRGAVTTSAEDESPQAIASGLTWSGHEFAAAARSDTVWNKARSMIKEKVGSVSLAVLTDFLASLAKSTLGI